MKAEVLGRLQTAPVWINGKTNIALLYTRSTQTLIQPHLVDRGDFVPGGKLRVQCVNGDEHKYPGAEVCLAVGGQTYQMAVGVVKGLSHSVVIGQDILVLPESVQLSPSVSMVVTRSQSRAPGPHEVCGRVGAQPLLQLPFSSEDITGPDRTRVRKVSPIMLAGKTSGDGKKESRWVSYAARYRVGGGPDQI